MLKLWKNATFYTMRKEGDFVEAVCTKNDRILRVGTLEELLGYEDTYDEIIDLNGQVVFPGFVDSHLHILWLGEKLSRLDLSSYTKRSDVLKAVESAVANLEKGRWLIADGWNDNQWDDRTLIDREELDAISTEHHIVLNRICKHALVTNTLTMNHAKIDETTEEPFGGKFMRDDTGRLTGYFKDSAQDLIKACEPEKTIEELSHLVDLAIDHLLKHGIVGGHSEDLSYFGKNSFQRVSMAYQKSLHENNRLFRAHLLVHHHVLDDYMQSNIQETDYLEYGAMKLFIDGAFGGRTAWLYDPYEDASDNYGLQIHSEADLMALVKSAREKNLAVAIHAIGDQAIDMFIQLVETHPNTSHLPDRLIHGMLPTEKAMERLRYLPVIIDFQPTFVTTDFPWVIERLGINRIRNSYPWRTYLDKGIVLAASSDAPIEDIDPIQGIIASVTRQSTLDQKPYLTEQCLSLYQAIEAYTLGSATAINKQDDRGQIKPGHLADFTVFNKDPFELEVERLKNLCVTYTIVSGKVQFQLGISD